MKHYCYRHIRLDTGEPFYIGIGSKSDSFYSYKSEYNRAYSKVGRNIYWKRIVNLYGYEIEILFESDDPKLIERKEKEFINIYGRKDIKTGILCNKTDGGWGIIGFSHSKETRDKISKSNIERLKNNPESFKSFIYGNKTKSKESYLKTVETKRKRGLLKISEKQKKKLSKSHIGISNIIIARKNKERMSKPIIKFSLSGEPLKYYNSIVEAEREMNTSLGASGIRECLRGNTKTSFGFIWKYNNK